jgi:hypothetical protein
VQYASYALENNIQVAVKIKVTVFFIKIKILISFNRQKDLKN